MSFNNVALELKKITEILRVASMDISTWPLQFYSPCIKTAMHFRERSVSERVFRVDELRNHPHQ